MLIPVKNFRHLRVPRGGWTIVEMMVALAAGTMILAAIVMGTITVSNTMVGIGNYNDLDKLSSHTLDMFSRDVRNAASVGGDLSSTFVRLTNSYNNTTVAYSWDGSNAVTRTYINSGVTNQDILLKNCDTFAFNYYQRNPSGSFIFVTSSVPAQVKLISVSWRCSRMILGNKLNTESVQTASVVIRN
jgi:hypothetical protein